MRISDQVFNRLCVLKKLRAAEPVSRTELARLSGLNGGTITAIVRDLVDRGLVIEERRPSPQRGRPRLDLRINAAGAYVVGATLTAESELLADIVDLGGRCVHSHSTRVTATSSLADLADQMAALVTQAIAASAIPPDRIAQVGIGLPAIVDNQAGIVEQLETFGDAPFAFAAAVERKVGITTRVDNNYNLLARAEHWFGDGTGIDDFTLVLLDLGIGAARYQAGQLLIGSHGIEAELGHVKIVPEGGLPCHCGGMGCLQAYSSISGIVYQAAALAGETPPGPGGLQPRFAQIAEAVRSGDRAMALLVERAGLYLGRAIANHINMQDPDRVIVLAKSAEFVELIRSPFFAALDRDTLPVLRDLGRITFKETDDALCARGAAALVLEQLYRER